MLLGLWEIGKARGGLVKDKCDLLASVGYEIARSVPHAPFAAWARARSGQVADALTGIGRLASLQEVENVEPQLVTERVHRDASRPSGRRLLSLRHRAAAPAQHRLGEATSAAVFGGLVTGGILSCRREGFRMSPWRKRGGLG